MYVRLDVRQVSHPEEALSADLLEIPSSILQNVAPL